MVVVPKPGQRPDKADLGEFLTGQVAKWWLPDDIVFAEQLPFDAAK